MHTANSFEEGKIILINKPLGWTSFDVIRKLRSTIKLKKIGHAGTLDPLATGLLILCTGKFTKKINEYMAAEKEYTGTFTIGAITPTYDLESEPQQFKSFAFVSAEMIKKTAMKFTGEIDQVPPIHSAIKQGGKPVYLLARKGIDVKLAPRKIFIKEFLITNIELPVISFRVVCTTGTYIRSLANDFGDALGTGAYLSSLCRTRIGAFNIDSSLSPGSFIEQLKTTSLT
ncbi:MAG: tRNA pseudouridine(55) synthase TruB [Ginsengibacter sp.]